LHGPSKGEYVKSLISVPSALVAPDLIKVENVPTKKVYDFTKHSQNYRLFDNNNETTSQQQQQQANFSLENLEYEEKRCDSRLKEEDLKLLEIELKKKQKRRIKKERRIAEGGNPLNRNRRRDEEDDEERKEAAVDENGNVIRRGD
jgi:hypothetical protein